MRLSTAIMLGDTLRRRDPETYLESANGDSCGCALGGASLALGHVKGGFDKSWLGHLQPKLEMEYPWVDDNFCNAITAQFFSVCDGEITFEQLIDYVRSVEPGCDCGRFNCNCAAKQQKSSILAQGVTVQP